MNRPTTYSLFSYGQMINDLTRMDAYAEALRQSVRPGSVVIDLGAGTGIFSLLACQLGAARVYAIEPDDSLHVARELAVANGYADRITFVQGVSTAVELPDRADLIVSDLHGVLPLLEQHIPSIVDARERLLVPGGVQIPAVETLWVALLEDEERHRNVSEPWSANRFGLDMKAGHRLAMNHWHRASVKADQLLSAPQLWATLDYRTIVQPNVSGGVELIASRAGRAHGLLLWFDSELAGSVRFSNAPGQPELIYGQALFPLSEPVDLEPGDRVSVNLRAVAVAGDYEWTWETRVVSAETGEVKFSSSQSTFYGTPLSPDRLRTRGAGFVPDETDSVRVERTCLDLVDGNRSLGEIADALVSRFPDRFASQHRALTFVADLFERHRA